MSPGSSHPHARNHPFLASPCGHRYLPGRSSLRKRGPNHIHNMNITSWITRMVMVRGMMRTARIVSTNCILSCRLQHPGPHFNTYIPDFSVHSLLPPQWHPHSHVNLGLLPVRATVQVPDGRREGSGMGWGVDQQRCCAALSGEYIDIALPT